MRLPEHPDRIVLALGLCSFCGFFQPPGVGVITGVMALAFGIQCMKEIRAGRRDPAERDFTEWGLCLAAFGVVFSAMQIFAIVEILIMLFEYIASGGGE